MSDHRREVDGEVPARIASGPQDAVSESRLGWGRQRPWPPAGR